VALGAPRDLFPDSWRRELLEGGIENILRGTVIETSGEMAVLALAGGIPLEVSCTDIGLGERTVLGIRSDEILVALAPPTGLSARNALPAVVKQLDPCRAGIVLRAVLQGSSESLDVVLTRKSTEALGLRAGSRVFLVVKSNSVRILSHLSAPKSEEGDGAPDQA
jgi:molybdopterin-binding protein